jgi:hypothetical protein
MTETTCDRCGLVYNRFLGMRFWSGEYVEVVDGVHKVYLTLCDDCHRDVVRE